MEGDIDNPINNTNNFEEWPKKQEQNIKYLDSKQLYEMENNDNKYNIPNNNNFSNINNDYYCGNVNRFNNSNNYNNMNNNMNNNINNNMNNNYNNINQNWINMNKNNCNDKEIEIVFRKTGTNLNNPIFIKCSINESFGQIINKYKNISRDDDPYKIFKINGTIINDLSIKLNQLDLNEKQTIFVDSQY